MTTTLIVADYDDRGWDGLAPILAELERRSAAPVVADRESITSPRGRVISQRSVSFDAEAVRDTHVHGWACNAGYVAHIEH